MSPFLDPDAMGEATVTRAMIFHYLRCESGSYLENNPDVSGGYHGSNGYYKSN